MISVCVASKETSITMKRGPRGGGMEGHYTKEVFAVYTTNLHSSVVKRVHCLLDR